MLKATLSTKQDLTKFTVQMKQILRDEIREVESINCLNTRVDTIEAMQVNVEKHLSVTLISHKSNKISNESSISHPYSSTKMTLKIGAGISI